MAEVDRGLAFIRDAVGREVRRAVAHVGGDGDAAVEALLAAVAAADRVYAVEVRFHLAVPDHEGRRVVGARYEITHNPKVRNLRSDGEYEPDQELPEAEAEVRVVLQREDPGHFAFLKPDGFDAWPAPRRFDYVDSALGHVRVWPPRTPAVDTEVQAH